MHSRAAEFVEQVRKRYTVDVAVEEFPEGTKTAEDAAAAVGCEVAQIASSLVFVVDGIGPVVAVTSGANRVDEDRLADHFDAESVAMADAETVKSATGWSIGGVPPFCHDSELSVLLDPTLTEYETVWAAAGTPEAVFAIAPEQLNRLAEAIVVDVTEG